MRQVLKSARLRNLHP